MKAFLSIVAIGVSFSCCGCRQPQNAPGGSPASPLLSPALVTNIENKTGSQESLLAEFYSSGMSAFTNPNALLLSELWRQGLLKDEIKERLTREHFGLVFNQLHNDPRVPSFEVRYYQTFPFPDTWTEFTPALYRNDKVEWAPNKPQTGVAMSQYNVTLTSRSGGVIKNGDVLQYRIDLQQTVPPRGAKVDTNSSPKVWRMSLWTQQLVVDGLEE